MANIAKISPDGDSLWHKTYSIIEGNVSRHYINDMEPTSDGGYIAIGELWCGATDSTGYWIDPWAPAEFPCIQTLLLKINEDGEIIPDTSSHTIDVASDFLSDQVRIYPTPTTDLLYIEQKDIRNLNYELVDGAGQILKSFYGPIPHHTYIANLQEYPSGVYYLRIRDDLGHQTVEKIVRL